MPTANDLNVHDVNVSEFVTFGPGPYTRQMRAVTFYVGTHGPFRLEYAKAEATPDRVKMDIQAEVQQLRSVTSV